MGYIIYDASGEVVTNTLPVTLTDKLVSRLNPSANLQYNGQRWYDAGLGLHLQPGPFGGAPALQSLNQYAGTVSWNGVVGTYTGFSEGQSQSELMSDFGRWVVNNWQKNLLDVGYSTLIEGLKRSPGLLHWNLGLYTVHSQRFFYQYLDEYAAGLTDIPGWQTKNLARPARLTGLQLLSGQADELIRTTQVDDIATAIQVAARTEVRDLSQVARLSKVLEWGIAPAIEGGLQVWEDWDRTDLTLGQKAGRAGVATVGGLASVGVAGGAVALLPDHNSSRGASG